MSTENVVITGKMLAAVIALGGIAVACSASYDGGAAPPPSAGSSGGPPGVVVEDAGAGVTVALPTISGAPKLARARASLTLHGAGFGAMQAASTVAFEKAGAPAVEAWSDSAITLTVPAEAHGTDALTLTVGAVPIHIPLRILGASEPTIAAIAKGTVGAAAVRADGAVVTWGCPAATTTTTSGDPGALRELCTPHVYDVSTSRAGAGTGFERLSLGLHFLGIEPTGALHGWTGPVTPLLLPSGTGIASTDEGPGYLVVRKDSGVAERWTPVDAEKWTVAPAFGGSDHLVDVRAGWYFGVGLRDDGSVVAESAFPASTVDLDCGQASVPTGLAGVVAIAAGVTHALALKKDGTVTGWAGGSTCPLGTGAIPLPPTTLDRVVAIAAGDRHSLALRDDGTVVGWGSDVDAVTSGPATLTGVVSIAAGRQSTIAVTEDGLLHAWGTPATGLTWDVTKLPSGFVARLPD